MNQNLPKFLLDKNLIPNVEINPDLNFLGTETAFGFGAEVIAVENSKKFPQIYKFHVGDTGPTTPEPIINTAIQALKDKQTKYGHYLGYLQVRQNIANYWSETRGVKIKPENILLEPAGKSVIEMALQTLITPDDKIIVPDPSYPVYESLAEFYHHGQILHWQAYKDPEKQNLKFRIEDLEKLFEKNQNIKLLIINTPQNPTGMMLDREILEQVAELVKKYKFFVLFDDIYDQITFGGRKHFSFLSIPGMLDYTVNLNGFSKNYAMTGWRLGFIVAPAWLIEIFGRMAINKWSNVNKVQQIVAGAIYGDVDLDGHHYPSIKDKVQKIINQDFVEYEKKGGFVSEALNLLKPYAVCNEAEGAFYLFPCFQKILDLPYVKNELKIKNDVELRNWFLHEKGVAVLAGSDFGQMGRKHIRFSYAEDREKHIIPGIKHILKTILELIKKSNITPPFEVDEVDNKVGELIKKYFD
ncbi:MAG: Aspartate aminotransferase [Candidatus Magasanikbacteria bacterium GW2011_GWA2_37_8]|uniref:Aminotransferase n=1 Tax=Candidatus Magasanikbacteria bacterium GW2011_GWA2_37_8 TaxID=1619036 RepID=A0A0G0KFT6_9BACT|nr:MAG: Aspartate aminotransferase [Candidatus Magasanikbacteria bacterium GW2011_GWA2_37_8]